MVCRASLLSPQNQTKMHFTTKPEVPRQGFFSCPFGENKRLKSRERRSGRERGRKRAEKAEDNSRWTSRLQSQGRGTAPGRLPPPPRSPAQQQQQPVPAWEGKAKGHWAALMHRAGRAGLRGQRGKTNCPHCPLPPTLGISRRQHFFLPKKPLPQRQGALGYAFLSFNAPRVVSTFPSPSTTT